MKAKVSFRPAGTWALIVMALLFCRSVAHAQGTDLKKIQAAADKGDAKAQFLLGRAYFSGQDAAPDYIKAAGLFQKAAEQGNAMAQNNLGMMYLQGKGVKQDTAQSIKWLSKAAEQGNGRAQSNLGRIYSQGEGVEQDPVKAYLWLKLSSEQRESGAGNALEVLKKGMTPAQIAEGEKRVNEFKAKTQDSGKVLS